MENSQLRRYYNYLNKTEQISRTFGSALRTNFEQQTRYSFLFKLLIDICFN